MGSAIESHAESHIDVLDPHALPLGDGKVSNTPKRGYVYSCNTQFGGGGADQNGSWIHGSTWDATVKTSVQGDVAWPDARFNLSVANGTRVISGNGLPVRHTTGTFPVGRSDPAYAIDRNPNSISAQQIAFSLPLSPTTAATPQCVPMGMIGVALSGVAIFNALDGGGRDAVAHEVQDHCSGHPQRSGQYHYHGPTSCLPAVTSNNALVGYALDGFGIYSMYDEKGRELTNADLDECHGRVSRIVWDGKDVTMYHYVMTREYPYTIGCFRGTPARAQQRAAGADDGQGRSRGGPSEERPEDGSQRNGRPMGRPHRNGPPEGRPDDQSQRSGAPEGQQRGPSQRSGPPDGSPDYESERGGPPGGGRGPPPEALSACSGRSSGAQCQFVSPRGDSITGTCRSPGGALACVPERR